MSRDGAHKAKLTALPSTPRRSAARGTRPSSGDYVIFIVPDRHHRVRRIRLTRRRLKQSLWGLAAVLVLVMASAAHYAFAVREARRVPGLLAHELALQSQLRSAQLELGRLEGEVQQIDRQLEQVRAITQLNDPARNLAMEPQGAPESRPSPVLYLKGERIDHEDELVDSASARRLFAQNLEQLGAATTKVTHDSAELSQYLAQRPLLVSHTPSIYPVASRLLTARFGPRRDPFTGQDVLHKGVDFAADLGAMVWAPADGRVIYAGPRGMGLGDVLVLDHGFAVQTHFAHLSRIDVRLGDFVRRGQEVARVGNSGRSTGPHLHYEVRIAGLPQDPEPYLLD